MTRMKAFEKRLVGFSCLLLTSTGLYAQEKKDSIYGKVVSETNQPVADVRIQYNNSNKSVLTDSLGGFRLPKSNGNILFANKVGYKVQQVAAGGNKDFLIVLRDSIAALDDVIVVGYGTARKKDLTGAIQTINMENSPLANLPNTNALQALTTTVAGVIVPPQSSPGQDPLSSMTIRGDRSIDPGASGLNKPLIVVDDIIFNGTLNQLNMQDVASLSILKDASAAAIYGSRSANGVIIITTKKGKSGKPVITLNSSYGFQNWSRKPQLQMDIDKMLKVRWDYFINAGRIPKGTEFNPSLILTAQELEAYNAGIKTNWLDEVTQKAPVHNHNLSIAGSSANTNYYLSAGILDQKGVIYNDNYRKATFLMKVETNINQYFTVGAKANYYTADHSGLTPSMQQATWMSPLSSTKTLTKGYEDWIPSNPSGTSAKHPMVGFARQVGPAYASDENKSQNIDGSGWLIVKAPWVKGLSYKFSINGTYTHAIYNLDVGPKMFVDTRNTANMDNWASNWNMAYSTASSSNTKTWLMNHILTYNRSFGSHNIDAMAGYTRDAWHYNNLFAQGAGYKMPNNLKWNGINLATTQTVLKNESAYQNVASMFRLNYNYKNTYYFTGTFRRDGYSGFAPGHKFGSFPGVSVGWVLSQESFMSKAKWVDYLKFRTSWGQNGNQSIAPYETLATMAQAYTVFGSDAYQAIYPNRMPNADLSWSTTTTLNFGLDYNLFGNRISGTVDFYHGKTRDQLLTRTIPILNGFSTVRTNIGRVDNKGIELVLNTVPIMPNKADGFRWDAGIIFSKNINKIVELYGTVDDKGNPQSDISATPAGDAYIIGKPIHSVWDYKMVGIVQKDDKDYMQKYNAKPGDVKFLDYNNDGKLNSSDYFYQGNRDPLFMLNVNNTFTYGNWSLYFSIKWNAGNKSSYLGKDRFGAMSSASIAGGSQLKNIQPWTEENPNNQYPRVDWVNSMGYWFWNTRNFVKLKDLSLAYTFKEPFLSKTKLKSLRVFVSGNNLLTFTKWSGLDPEDGGTIAANPGSIYYGSFPVLRTFTGGLVLSF